MPNWKLTPSEKKDVLKQRAEKWMADIDSNMASVRAVVNRFTQVANYHESDLSDFHRNIEKTQDGLKQLLSTIEHINKRDK